MSLNSRRTFLKKSLKVGVSATLAASVAKASAIQEEVSNESNVVVGKSTKKEVLYKKTQNWEQYYKIAY